LKRPDQKKDAGTPRRRRIHSRRSDF
jgi:hypothetical protein